MNKLAYVNFMKVKTPSDAGRFVPALCLRCSLLDIGELCQDVVGAYAARYKAKAAVSSSTSGINSELSDAMEHQAKLQQKQSEELARLDAANEYEDQKNGQSFNRELQEAGLVSGGVSADDILP